MAQLVRILTPIKRESSLSKGQKEFNRLTEAIGELEVELSQFRAVATQIQQRIYTEYEPLLRDYTKLRADLVRVFDRAYTRGETTKTERKKLASLILDLTYDLIRNHGLEELKPLHDKYDVNGFDAAEAIPLAAQDELMQAEQAESERAATREERQKAEERRTNESKSAKRQKREAREQRDIRNTTKAVRTLYVDLVKAFHPDREPDEAEKIRKTEIMTRVTEAYEKSDLLTLLRLQLEFNRIDQTHLETLADDQLRYYNKILKQQADELSDELLGLQSQLASVLGKPLMVVRSTVSLEFSFNSDIRELKRTIKSMKNEIRALANYDVLKAFLKNTTSATRP